jgi:RHS repeat-associated protein
MGDGLNRCWGIHDVLGQKTDMIDPDMGQWKYGYDLGGNLITQTDNIGQVLWFKYDKLNRLTEKRQTNSSGLLLASYGYDQGTNAIGKRVSMNDPSGGASWTYDTRGRVVNDVKSINNAGTFTTSLGYDAMDRVLTTTYPTGEVITQTYNAMGALENVRSQSNNQWYASNLDYNANGSIAKLDLGNGLSTLYGYFGFTANQWDARPGLGLTSFGRLWRTRIEAPSGQPLQDLRYSYDSVGNITYINDLARSITGTLVPTMTDAFTSTAAWTLSGNVTIPYIDSGNTVAAITRTGSIYTDNLVRNQYTLVSGSGAQVKFKTNNANSDFVIGIENNDATNRRLAIYADGTGHVRVQYNDGATATSWRYPVVLTPTIQANVWYTLTFLVDDVRGNTLEVYTSTTGTHYTYNIGLSSGKQWRFHAWVGTNTLYLDDYKEFKSGVVVTPDDRMYFTYDSLDRLLSATGTTTGGYTQTYGYNPIGNIISTTMLGAYTYTASGPNSVRPHAATGAGNNAYTYDGNGNMLTRVESNITYTQKWDTENRLTTVTNTATSPNIVSKFIYDGDGNRVMQLVISGTSILTTAYASAIEIAISSTARITKTYYSAGSQLIAMRVITSPTAPGTLYFMHSDHLGSSSLTTDASGNVVARQLYDAWGNIRSGGTMPTDIGYTGQRLDATGLMFYHARYYSSAVGRFISADTLVPGASNPQNWNRYAYVTNNPLKYIDPTGHGPTPYDEGGQWDGEEDTGSVTQGTGSRGDGGGGGLSSGGGGTVVSSSSSSQPVLPQVYQSSADAARASAEIGASSTIGNNLTRYNPTNGDDWARPSLAQRIAQDLSRKVSLIDKLKTSDVCNSYGSCYDVAKQTAVDPKYTGIPRGVIEFPEIGHAVMGYVDQNGQVMTVENSLGSFGKYMRAYFKTNTVSLSQYQQWVRAMYKPNPNRGIPVDTANVEDWPKK